MATHWYMRASLIRLCCVLRRELRDAVEIPAAFVLATASVSTDDDHLETNDPAIELCDLPKALVVKCR